VAAVGLELEMHVDNNELVDCTTRMSRKKRTNYSSTAQTVYKNCDPEITQKALQNLRTDQPVCGGRPDCRTSPLLKALTPFSFERL